MSLPNYKQFQTYAALNKASHDASTLSVLKTTTHQTQEQQQKPIYDITEDNIRKLNKTWVTVWTRDGTEDVMQTLIRISLIRGFPELPMLVCKSKNCVA